MQKYYLVVLGFGWLVLHAGTIILDPVMSVYLGFSIGIIIGFTGYCLYIIWERIK